MATIYKRDFIIFTFVHTEDALFQNQALEATKNIITRKIFQRPHDLIQVCGWNGEKLDRCFDNLHPTDLTALDQIVKFVKNEKFTNSGNTDEWIPALHTSIKYITELLNSFSQSKNDDRKNHNSFQLILFTSLSKDPVKIKYLDRAIANHTFENVTCYILGPKINIPNTFFESDLSREKFINEIEPCLRLKYDERAVPVLQYIKKTNGVVADLNRGQHLVEYYKPVLKHPQEWKVVMTIGDDINISIVGLRYTVDLKDPSMESKYVTDEGEIDYASKVFIPDVEHNPLLDEIPDDAETLHKQNENSDFLTTEEKMANKLSTLRCLDVLFVIDKNEINELYNCGDAVYQVYPQMNHSEVFQSFVTALAEKNCVAIARKCYNKNNNPKLVALIPFRERRQNSLLMVQMPYSDYIQKPLKFYASKTNLWNQCTSNEKNPSSPDLQEAVTDFLNDLTLDDTVAAEIEYLPPYLMASPRRDYLFNFMINRMFDADYKIDNVEIPRNLQSPECLIEKRRGDAVVLEKTLQNMFG